MPIIYYNGRYNKHANKEDDDDRQENANHRW